MAQPRQQPSAAEQFAPDPGAEWEAGPRWVRVKFGGETIADSKRVMLMREVGRLPVYYFPQEDVRTDLLEASRHVTHNPGKGKATYWSVKVADKVAEDAAWAYQSPGPEWPALKDYVAFEWKKMAHWYEEEEEVFVHPRDPYKRIDTMPSSRHIRVVIDGVTVADSKRPHLLFETWLPNRYYLPQEDVNMALLTPTETHSRCPYKGIASYWSVKVGDRTYKDIVWTYPDPIPECPKIKDLLCFFNEKVDLYVDGQLQERPKTKWS
jgi:uncharacterized protein (DUF427 family)